MTLMSETRRFTADEYMRMSEAGILGEDDRVELINGEIRPMSPIGNRHIATVNRLTRMLIRHVGDRGIVQVQSTLRLGEFWMPEPDLCVLKPDEDFYLAGAGPADVRLIIEVCDTTLEYDRRVKVPGYAEAGIPEVWLIDLVEVQTLVYRRPAGRGYAEEVVRRRDEALSPLAFDDLRVTTAQMTGA